DVADAEPLEAVEDRGDLRARVRDARQMAGRRQAGLVLDAARGLDGPLARRAPRAVGQGDEVRRQRLQAADRFDERAEVVRRLREKELEGEERPLRGGEKLGDVGHAAGILANRAGGEPPPSQVALVAARDSASSIRRRYSSISDG